VLLVREPYLALRTSLWGNFGQPASDRSPHRPRLSVCLFLISFLRYRCAHIFSFSVSEAFPQTPDSAPITRLDSHAEHHGDSPHGSAELHRIAFHRDEPDGDRGGREGGVGGIEERKGENFSV